MEAASTLQNADMPKEKDVVVGSFGIKAPDFVIPARHVVQSDPIGIVLKPKRTVELYQKFGAKCQINCDERAGLQEEHGFRTGAVCNHLRDEGLVSVENMEEQTYGCGDLVGCVAVDRRLDPPSGEPAQNLMPAHMGPLHREQAAFGVRISPSENLDQPVNIYRSEPQSISYIIWIDFPVYAAQHG